MVRINSTITGIVGCLTLASAATMLQAEGSFPYVAYVTSDEAFIRSGPSKQHYPTDQLPAGYAVEIYRHNAGGWCAIRPPEGSFSWIASHQLRPLNEQMAMVVEDGVVARAGSTLADDRSAVQVMLQKGEQVRTLPNRVGDDPRWTRIHAPAGEFRWIAATDLARKPPMESSPALQGGLGWIDPAVHSSQSNRGELPPQPQAPGPFDHLTTGTPPSTSPSIPSTEAVPQSVSPQTSPASAEAEVNIIAGSPAELQLTQFESPPQASEAPPSADSEDSNEAVSATTASPEDTSLPRVRLPNEATDSGELAERIAELELRLSEMVVKNPEQWQFEQLRSEASQLLEESDTAEQRNRLRDVLDRVAMFQQVRQRYLTQPRQALPLPSAAGALLPMAEHAPTAPSTSNPDFTGLTDEVRDRIEEDFAGSNSPLPGDPFEAESDRPLFEATGLLKPVVSRREQAPEFALVDERGEVVSFVTPTPEMNLKPYLGKRIGVHGARGYIPEFRRPHVTASRVTPLKETLRR